MNKPVILVVAVVLAGLIIISTQEQQSSAEQKDGSKVEEKEATGDALIGGPFSLINQNGERVTNETFKGKNMLVFFGFTNCPDVCPTGLLTMTKALESVEDIAPQIVPIFITVDSETDTKEQIASYISNFHPSMQGLTGTEEELKKAQDSYRVYAKKIEMEGSMMDAPMFNHSGYIYLMSKDGKYLTHFSYDAKPEDIVLKIREYIS